MKMLQILEHYFQKRKFKLMILKWEKKYSFERNKINTVSLMVIKWAQNEF